MNHRNKVSIVLAAANGFACGVPPTELGLEELSPATVSISRRGKPEVAILSPLHGSSLLEGANLAGVEVELAGLNPAKQYRVVVNGMGSVFVEGSLLSAVEDTIRDISVPELANVPGFDGALYPLRALGKLRVNDVVTFYVAFD